MGATVVLVPASTAGGAGGGGATTANAAGGPSLLEPIVPAELRRADRPDMARWRSPLGAPLLGTLLGVALALLPVEDRGTVLLLSGEDRGGEDDGEDEPGDTLEPVASDAAAAAAAFLLDRSDRIFTRLSARPNKNRNSSSQPDNTNTNTKVMHPRGRRRGNACGVRVSTCAFG